MRKPAVAATLAAVVLGATLASCAADDAEPTADEVDETPSVSSTPPSSTPPSSTPASPSSATATPTSSAPTATLTESESPTTATARAAVDVAARLLPAARVGKLNAEWTWVSGNDFDREPRRLVACHRFRLDVIGVDEVAVREYSSELDAGVSAHHLVAGFADDVTARRAYSVLESWRSSCQSRLEERARGRDGVRVSDPEPLRGLAGATSYVVFQPTATGSTRIENVAMSRSGRVIDLVVVELEGDDFNYPRGRTPAAVSIRNAAQRGG